MRLIILILTLSAVGCTTLKASKGDMALSRTAFGVNLEVSKATVTATPDGGFSLSLEGTKSDTAAAIQAATSIMSQAAAAAIKP